MDKSLSVDELFGLVSETRNPRTTDIDLLSAFDLATRINTEDKTVAHAVEAELPAIGKAIESIVAAFRRGGRLIYIGAGTSGRLGVLDASECPPTFSVPPEMVVGLIAGGDVALRTSVEGAEDDRDQGGNDLHEIDLCAKDVVVGIAVSGRTPYVIGALETARELGAGAIALTCNPDSEMSRIAELTIAPVVGPEVLTGSTRLKSGTAQKLVLNMLSTGAMIQIGKSYENLMVDVAVSNRKLATRAIGIICETTGVTEPEAETLLGASGNDVKLAIFMQITGLARDESKAYLATSHGVLRRAIEEARTK